MDTLFRHFRTALRKLRRSPFFALLAIFTLALGIGANAAIWNVVDTVLLRPLPYPESERLVGVWHTAPGLDIPQFGHSDATYLIHRELNTAFEDLALYQGSSATLTGEGTPERLSVARVTPSLLPVLQVEPAMGRGFTEAEGVPGAERTILLSHGLWSQRFGAATDILGRRVEIDGTPRTVIGVMAPDFTFPDPEIQAWLPLAFDTAQLQPGNFNYDGVARLVPGATPEQAAEAMASHIFRMPELYPESRISKGMLEQARFAGIVHPLHQDVVGTVGNVLWPLLASVGLILLIACANVANLFLVRAEGRQQELAVRGALGARRSDLALGFFSESLLLALGAAGLGLGLAWGGLELLIAYGPQELPRLTELGIEQRTLLFTLALAVSSGLLFGLLPALRRAPDPGTALKEGGRSSTGGGLERRARAALVVGQIALALVLLAGSGLMVRSFQELGRVDPGFDTEGLLTFRIALPDANYPDQPSRLAFHQQALETLGAMPGVEASAAVSHFPLAVGNSNSAHTFEDFPVAPDTVPPILDVRYTSEEYFTTAGIPLIEGRTFESTDLDAGQRVVVISEDLARRLWPNESAVGKRIYRGVPEDQEIPWSTIVGVVGSVHHEGLDRPTTEAVFYPLVEPADPTNPNDQPYTPRSLVFALRSDLPAASLTESVRAALRELDPDLPLAQVNTAEQLLSASRARTAFTMTLLLLAAVVALVLGTVGLYGTIAYSVSQRLREIGVRMALGAHRSDVTRMVVGQGLVLAGLGVGLGLLGAFGATRLLSSLLFGVSAQDPLTFMGVALLLLTVATLASWLPARRAAAVSPLEALRYE